MSPRIREFVTSYTRDLKAEDLGRLATWLVDSQDADYLELPRNPLSSMST